MMQKHTPGPWRVLKTKTNIGEIDVCIIPTGFFCKRNSDDPEIMSNAALIAAAPEMLEALEAIVEGTPLGDGIHRDMDSIFHLGDKNLRRAFDKRLQKANQVIKKARGEDVSAG